MPNKLLEKGKASLCISLPGVTTLNIAKIEGKVLWHHTVHSSFSVLMSVTPDPAIFISSSILPAFVHLPCLYPSLPWKKKHQITPQMQSQKEIVTFPAAGEVKMIPQSIGPLVRANFSSLDSGKSVSSGFIWVLSRLLWVLRLLSQCRMRSVVMPISGNWTLAWNVLEWHSLGPFPASSTTLGPFGAECTPIKEVKKPVH